MENYTSYSIEGIFTVTLLIYIAIFVLLLPSYWVLFRKAGEPGWTCLVPIYNVYIMLEIGGKPSWWIILMLIPIVNFVVGIMAIAAFLKAFGRDGVGPVLLIIFFSIIYIPYLAFSKNVQYVGFEDNK
ncbi:hypothetical protein BN3590_02298 [Clostridium sp. C105KSO15]|nr:hypothetical protein BN3590_02298 [Clostridium sp. C105KSO15]